MIYIAPEVLREHGDRTILQKQAADVYAFGVVLYEILQRDAPFDHQEAVVNNSSIHSKIGWYFNEK